MAETQKFSGWGAFGKDSIEGKLVRSGWLTAPRPGD